MNLTLSTSISNESVANLGSWFRLNLLDETEAITTEEAANFIDELYGTSICDNSQDIPVCGGEIPKEAGVQEPPTLDEITEVGNETLDVESCREAFPTYERTIELHRSDMAKQYKIVYENGVQLQAVIVEQPVKLTIGIESQSSIALEYNITRLLNSGWSGHPIDSDGNLSSANIVYDEGVFTWGEQLTGVLSLEFIAIWVEVTIEINREGEHVVIEGFSTEEEQTASCYAKVFYDKMVKSVTIIEIPLEDEMSENYQICGDVLDDSLEDGSTSSMNDDTSFCYNEVLKITRCQCSGDISSFERVIEEVTCPSGAGSGRHLYQTITETVAFADCGETTGLVGNATYFEQKCCYPPDFTLPKCTEVIQVNNGGDSLSEEEKEAFERQYENVEFIPVSPEDGDCGTIKTVQVIPPINCCDAVPELIYDDDNSVDVLDDNDSGVVSWLGGGAPFTVKIRGYGFSFVNGLRDVLTNSNYLDVYTGEACGTAIITIQDSCGQTVDGGIRSVNGQWDTVYQSTAGIEGDGTTPPYDEGCPFMGEIDYYMSSSATAIQTEGEYRITQGVVLENCYGAHYIRRSDFADIVSSCESNKASVASCVTNHEYTMKGFCFNAIDQASECVVFSSGSNSPVGNWISLNPGHNSVYWFSSGWYSSYRYFTRLTSTKVERWVC